MYRMDDDSDYLEFECNGNGNYEIHYVTDEVMNQIPSTATSLTFDENDTGLFDLPDLKRFENLTYLDFENVGIWKLPFLSQTLLHLNIEHNHFVDKDKRPLRKISFPPNLLTLNMSKNTFDFSNLILPVSLERFEMHGKSYRTVPCVFKIANANELVNMKYLDIGNNNLISIDGTLPPNLKILRASRNNLSKLPDISNVQELYIDENNFEDISQLGSNIITLHISKNPLKNIPILKDTIQLIIALELNCDILTPASIKNLYEYQKIVQLGNLIQESRGSPYPANSIEMDTNLIECIHKTTSLYIPPLTDQVHLPKQTKFHSILQIHDFIDIIYGETSLQKINKMSDKDEFESYDPYYFVFKTNEEEKVYSFGSQVLKKMYEERKQFRVSCHKLNDSKKYANIDGVFFLLPIVFEIFVPIQVMKDIISSSHRIWFLKNTGTVKKYSNIYNIYLNYKNCIDRSIPVYDIKPAKIRDQNNTRPRSNSARRNRNVYSSVYKRSSSVPGKTRRSSPLFGGNSQSQTAKKRRNVINSLQR